jgi:murein DD-endopeptidase MepM/ murein hydrolase activator NlpD
MDEPATDAHSADPSSSQTLRLLSAPTRLLAVAALIVVTLAGSAVQDRPEHGKRMDEANLNLAAALAQRDATVTRQPANAAVAHELHALRLRSYAQHVSHLDLTLDQLRSLMQPPETHPDPPLRWPAQGVVVSGYGLRAWPDFGRIHPGIDITNLPGTPIFAAADGTVVAARNDRLRGNSVIVDHGEQEQHPGHWTTVYGHLASIEVVEGQEVAGGEQIGTLGNSGLQTTGPHLHFEVRIEDKPVDPRRWLP